MGLGLREELVSKVAHFGLVISHAMAHHLTLTTQVINYYVITD